MKHVLKSILVIIFFGCTPTKERVHPLLLDTKSNLAIYNAIVDSFNIWVLNKLPNLEAERLYKYNIDSVICLNTDSTRFITCRHLMVNVYEAVSDDIQFVYGEKHNGYWYFFKGPSISVPRETFKAHNMHTPLSYQQLHEVALKEVYGGYLLPNGKINELWFKGHFEGIGWGDFKNQGPQNDWYLKGRRFKTEKEFYEAIHLDNVRNNWYGVNKDSIKQLPKKELP